MREAAPPGGRPLALPMARAEDVTRAVRGAFLHHAEDPPPPALSGHHPDGRPLDRSHAAFLALPDAGARSASGAILGVAVVLPRDVSTDDRQAVLLAAGRWERSGLRLLMGRDGAAQLEPTPDGAPAPPLAPATWTLAAQRWASVTPVALDRNPGDLAARDPGTAAEAARCAQETIAHACERIGLPHPASVQVSPRSLFDAVPAASNFAPFPRRGRGLKRVCVHAELHFDEPVTGPVLLGVGRYFGVGLFRPIMRGEG
jgi:CRISPR-associated protein Csb2